MSFSESRKKSISWLDAVISDVKSPSGNRRCWIPYVDRLVRVRVQQVGLFGPGLIGIGIGFGQDQSPFVIAGDEKDVLAGCEMIAVVVDKLVFRKCGVDTGTWTGRCAWRILTPGAIRKTPPLTGEPLLADI